MPAEKTDLNVFNRLREFFGFSKTSLFPRRDWFIAYILFTILAAAIITSLVLGASLYQKLKATFNFSGVIIGAAVATDQNQPGSVLLPELPAQQTGLATETKLPIPTPLASMTAQSANNGNLTGEPYVQIASLVMAPDQLCSPIDGVEIYELQDVISQLFNVPNQLSDNGHHGVDLGSYNFRGQYLYAIPIRAILAGNVAGITVNRPPIGNVVILETKFEDLPEFLQKTLDISPGESLYHFYGHLIDEPVFSMGTRVECGQQLNLLGKSKTVEAHLHLETRIGKSGLLIGPMAFYDAATTEEERSEYLRWRTSGDFRAIDPMTIFQLFP